MSEVFTLGDKQPYEEYYVTFGFKPWLGEADISSATVTAADTDDDSDVTSTVTDSTEQRIGTKTVDVWVRAGSTNKSYQLTCRIVATDGSKYELDALLPVVEL